MTAIQIVVRAPFVYKNWPYFFLSRFDEKPGVLKLWNGLKFCIRPRSSDRASITEVFMQQPYSQPKPGSVVVDIGANIGAFAVKAARTARIVYAVDPLESHLVQLRQNVILNGLSENIVPIQAAIGGRDGIGEISVDGVMSSLKWRRAGASSEKVPLCTFRRLLDDHGIDVVDLLKLDVEGSEWDILFGTDGSEFMRVQRIEMEYHLVDGCPGRDALVGRLQSLGFAIESIEDGPGTGAIKAVRTEKQA